MKEYFLEFSSESLENHNLIIYDIYFKYKVIKFI